MTSWDPNACYPDPAVEIIDPAFETYRLFAAGVERLAAGTRWGEGPVWFGDGRFLLWSDIPNNRILRWDEVTGQVSAFRELSNMANGNTRDAQGRLITCEHLGRRVTRTEHDGAITVLMDRWQGKLLNSPNDVIVKSDGSIWFTDPPFGIRNYYEGEIAEQELPTGVYRIGPDGGSALLTDEIPGANGLCFSPDERILYVVDSSLNPSRSIRAFDISGGGALKNQRLFVDAGTGTPDGIRCDVDGNLWCGWGMGTPKLNGVRVFNPRGRLIGRIALPERCANLCFGGRHRNRLFMACGHALYALYVNTQGASSV